MKRVFWTMWFVFSVLLLAEIARGADTTTDQIRAVLEENMAACTEEDLPRLMKTMSKEMPNRELFMEQCKKEWADHNLYYRLIDVKIVKQNRWRLPYLVATVTEEQREYNPEAGKEEQPVEEISHIMSIRTKTPVTQSEYLFKREGGKWKIVAGVSEERPVDPAAVIQLDSGNCRNGRCDKSKVSSVFK
jgi:hypothetical protein